MPNVASGSWSQFSKQSVCNLKQMIDLINQTGWKVLFKVIYSPDGMLKEELIQTHEILAIC